MDCPHVFTGGGTVDLTHLLVTFKPAREQTEVLYFFKTSAAGRNMIA